MKPTIDISFNYVEVEKQIVPRPKRISVSEWIKFWERVKEMAEE